MNKHKPSIIILHGWKLSGEKYAGLKKDLESFGYPVYAPDLPGFGKNLISNDQTMHDYVEYLDKFIQQKKITSCVLVGHSLGGRIIIASVYGHKTDSKYASIVNGIVLSGVPVYRSDTTLRKRVGKIIAKAGKEITSLIPLINQDTIPLRKVLYRFIGEYDYYKSGPLKNTFLNIVNYSLEDKIDSITIPTLLLWGEKDTITPFDYARKINRHIKRSKLVGVPEATHKLPYQYPELFAQHVDQFISSL